MFLKCQYVDLDFSIKCTFWFIYTINSSGIPPRVKFNTCKWILNSIYHREQAEQSESISLFPAYYMIVWSLYLIYFCVTNLTVLFSKKAQLLSCFLLWFLSFFLSFFVLKNSLAGTACFLSLTTVLALTPPEMSCYNLIPG